MEERGLDCSGSGLGQVAGCCEQGNEPSGCIKCQIVLDNRRHSVSQENFVPWSQTLKVKATN